MTVQPTHQSADGRKFVKVGELPVPARNYPPEIWQEVNTGEVVHRHLGGRFYSDGGGSSYGDITPIPQPEVRWIGVQGTCTTHIYRSREDVVGPSGCIPDFFIRLEFLNGVRTASIEEAK